jgi:RNA polymerase sigma-70 factor (ECF subfamily)
MLGSDRAAFERQLKVLRFAGELEGAATLAVSVYGPEVFGYLLSVLESRDDAAEVYTTFVEDLKRGLPAFRGRSSMRTWSYALARQAMCRYLRAPWRRREHLPSTRDPLDAAVGQFRSASTLSLRSSVRALFVGLRRRLSEEDQTLLTLRLDRKLSWEDVARVLTSDPLTDALIDKATVDRVRKQFDRVKKKLHDWAANEELSPSGATK